MIEVYKKIEYSEPSNSIQIPFIKRSYTTDPVSDPLTGQVAEEVLKLLKALSEDMSRKEIQAAIGLSGRANFEEHYLKSAIDDQYIEMTIPDKPKSRLQKYRLTAKGQKLLKAEKKD